MQENLGDHRASTLCRITATSWIRLARFNNAVNLPGLESDEREGYGGDPIGEDGQKGGHMRKVKPTHAFPPPNWGIKPERPLLHR